MAALSLLPTALERDSVSALLLELASCTPRGNRHRWESAIDGVVRRLHELRDQRAFEDLTELWRPRLTELVEAAADGDLDQAGVHELDTIVGAIECALEHLAGPGGLSRADLAVSYARTDAASLARLLSASFRTLAGRRGIQLTVDLPEEADVEIDPVKLETILLALLYNAFKHTPMRGSIRFSLRHGGPDDKLVLEFADSSPSIAAFESEALFEAGVHDRSATFEVGGRAVSLGTSRDFARLLGGSLVLRATQRRRGCVFEASFPAHAPRGVAVGSASPQPHSSGIAEAVVAQVRDELETESRLGVGADVARDDRPLALVVEDNPHTQRILALTLQPAYSVAAAFDGKEGVAKARALKPDIIITDVRMPHMDGEAMVHELRTYPELAEVPILVLTATDDRAVIVRLLEAGVEDVLRKPFEIPEVRARVRALVAAKRARDTLNATLGHQEDNLVALAEEVASRQRGLENALHALAAERDSARRANRVKSNFLRMMSHELRTPLAALQLQLHLLDRGAEASGNGAVDGVARMRRSVRRLTLLIETMTEWARVESGRFELEAARVDVAELLRGAIEEARAGATSKGIAIELTVEPLAPLSSDGRLVALLLHNLIGYAVQLSPRGPLAINAAPVGEAQQIRLRCSAPTGMDGPLDDEVFAAFHDDSDIGVRSGTGSGLGLRVVRDIARALGGDLELMRFEDGAPHEFVMTLRSADDASRGERDPLSAGGRHVDPTPPAR